MKRILGYAKISFHVKFRTWTCGLWPTRPDGSVLNNLKPFNLLTWVFIKSSITLIIIPGMQSKPHDHIVIQYIAIEGF